MADKRSKKRSKKDFYFSIISMIKKENRLPKDINKQRLNYYVRSLKTNNIIRKKGYGVWELTEIGKHYLSKEVFEDALVQPDKEGTKRSKKNDRFVRGHGFMWKIKTPLLNSKDKLFKTLDRKKLNPKLLNNKQIQIYLMGHNIKFGWRSIIVNFNPDIYYSCKTAQSCYKMAVYDLRNLIIRLENLLGYSLKVNKKHQFKPSKKHFGHVNNELAVKFNREGKYIQVFDEGKEWLVIDFSDNQFKEFETTDNDRNIIDSDVIIDPFFNKIRKHPKILDDIEAKMNQYERIITKQSNVIDYLMKKDERSVNIDKFKY